jgi:hypothetical protein
MMVVVEMSKETPPQQARADAPQVAVAPPAKPAAAPPAQNRDAAKQPDLRARADDLRANEAKTGKAIDAIQPARPAAPPATVAQPEVGQQQKPGGATARAEESSRQLAQRFDSRVLEIRAANPATRWRVTGTQVERSTDAGSTWTPVFTGVTGILAAAAPSDSICWLAGRGGIVLLSTDGTTWRRVTSPDTTDLSAIRATDGRTATVTTADGREFTTTDGGRTWVRRELQENRAPSF